MTDKSDNALQRGLENIQTPFSKFIRSQTTTSMFMLLAALVAIWWANSPYYLTYEDLLNTPAGFIVNDFILAASFRHIMNDGLMVLFFFLIGLEIKREILSGYLAQPKNRYTLILCAIGGMVFPAAIYLIFNWSLDSKMGWGIPMATDTAFALGALTLVKKHLPLSLFSFVVGLAIVDDIGAMIVIAAFYTEEISIFHLTTSLLLILCLAAANYAGIRHPFFYILVGVPACWLMYKSGVHPTFAGILIALTAPASPQTSSRKLLRKAKRNIDEIQKSNKPIDPLGSSQDHKRLTELRDYSELASAPLRRWEDALDLPVLLIILPMFALLNAGLPLSLESILESIKTPIGLGIICGLLIGKVVGISSACWLALRFKVGELPEGLNLKYIVGASFITGIGFTMSTFISTLGFDSQQENLQIAKTSILLASTLAAFLGVFILWFISKSEKRKPKKTAS